MAPLEKNRKNDDHSLTDLLDMFKRDIFLNLNCHAIAKINTFDPVKQTVTASISYKKTYFTSNPAVKGTYIPTNVDYPLLLDVPIIVLGGGGSTLTFPIQPGTQCLVLFNDRDIDNWFASGGQVLPNNSLRLHSLSDGIALIGLNPIPLENYDMTRAILKYKLGAEVGVGPVQVRIANQLTTLNTVIQQLVTALTSTFNAIQTATTTPIALGSPQPTFDPPALALIAAGIAQVSAASTQIGALLE